MNGFGEKLRREREMRGVSLDEISESTKIGTRSLRALEEDDFEKLPGGIFNKGFVRAYAKFLGLDEEQTVTDFEAAWKEFRATKGYPDDEVHLPIIEEKKEEVTKSGFSWLLAIAILMIVTLLVTWYVVEHQRPEEAVAPQPQSADSGRSSQVASSQTPRGTAGTETSASAPSASTSSSAPTASPSSEPATKPIQTETQNQTSPGTTKTTSSAGSNSEQKSKATDQRARSPIRLDVFAREDSWLSVLADGKNLGQGVLVAQKSRTIHAQKEVKLKLGNVGGVEVSFNGKPVNIDGEPKQVKELTFTADGLRQ